VFMEDRLLVSRGDLHADEFVDFFGGNMIQPPSVTID
jgi:hypothetical protein